MTKGQNLSDLEFFSGDPRSGPTSSDQRYQSALCKILAVAPGMKVGCGSPSWTSFPLLKAACSFEKGGGEDQQAVVTVFIGTKLPYTYLGK